MDLVDAALRCKKDAGRFAYVSPTYSQSKEIAWSYLKRFTAMIPGVEQRESDLMVIFPNGARVRLYGADNFDRLRGGYNDGLIMDEIGDIDPRAWPEVLRPSVADRKGWAAFIGTPRGHNHFYDTHQLSMASDDWYSAVLRASETKILPESELADMRQAMSEDQYRAEMECDFDAAIRGAIYRAELAAIEADGRICSVPYDPAVPVWTAWDLGIGDATAIWCAQLVGKEIHIIDYYEATGEALPHYVAWLDGKPYRYGLDLLPHDAGARELGTGKTREELLRANGRRVRVLPRQDIDDGINAAKMLLGRCWFDREATIRGRECLAHYRRDFNDKMGIYKDHPVHDWSSHCFEGATNVLTRCGTRRIMDLPETGEVLTPCGWNAYRNPRITARNAPLVAVVFSDGYTVRCTPEHLFLTVNGWTSACNLRKGSLIQSTLTPSPSISAVASTVFTQVTDTSREVVRRFIETFGERLLALFLPDAISITSMGTRLTTSFQTWSACQRESTFPLHGEPASELTSRRESISPMPPVPRPLNGTDRPKDGFGIVGTRSDRSLGQNGSASQSLAATAARRSMRWFDKTLMIRSIAHLLARPRHIATGIGLSKFAPHVARALGRWSNLGDTRNIVASNARTTPIEAVTRSSGSVVSFARRIWKSGITRTNQAGAGAVANAGALVVKQVVWLPDRADVWDITVPGVECFSLANGAVVHNSADAVRTLAMGLRETMPKPIDLAAPRRPVLDMGGSQASWMGA